MDKLTITTAYAQFTFLDDKSVVLSAFEGTHIDALVAEHAISLVESSLKDGYAIMLERKWPYSFDPIGVYQYFSGRARLRAIAIVSYKQPDALPEKMEQKIFKGLVKKFSSINTAHQWIDELFLTADSSHDRL